MVNEEIFGGLKLALSKGESFKQAMMSFYNAGYKREEIEEAAKALQIKIFEEQRIQQQKQLPEAKQKQFPVSKSEQPLRRKSKKKLIQKVPKYKKKVKTQKLKTPKSKIIKQKSVSALSPQKVSRYETPIQDQIQSSQKIRKGIDTAIKQLEKIKTPEQKKIKQKSVKSLSPKKVSSYEEKLKPKGKIITFLLIFSLLFLLGILIAIFFFKTELIEFANSLFG